MLKTTPLYGLPTCAPWFKTDIFYVYLSVCITIYLTTCLSVLSPPSLYSSTFRYVVCLWICCMSQLDRLSDWLSVRASCASRIIIHYLCCHLLCIHLFMQSSAHLSIRRRNSLYFYAPNPQIISSYFFSRFLLFLGPRVSPNAPCVVKRPFVGPSSVPASLQKSGHVSTSASPSSGLHP